MNSRSSRFTLLAIVAALFVNNLVAQEAADDAKPSFSASQSVQMTATVDAINMETREVTLRGEAGETQTITIGEEARNLGQVKTGDIVTVEFVRELDVQVFADDGSELTTEAVAAAGRAEEGEMPGGVAIQSEVVTARVAEINLENNTFKLQWPDDSVEEFVAQNPDNLRRAAVGDIVVITYTEAVGILVERPTAE
jgi:Cu/Ag efflux protein CusF